MTKFEYAMLLLSEECSEVEQRVTKLLRFGQHEVQKNQSDDNLTRLKYELSDLMNVIKYIKLEFGIDLLDYPETNKLEKINKWIEYSRNLGTIDKEADV